MSGREFEFPIFESEYEVRGENNGHRWIRVRRLLTAAPNEMQARYQAQAHMEKNHIKDTFVFKGIRQTPYTRSSLVDFIQQSEFIDEGTPARHLMPEGRIVEDAESGGAPYDLHQELKRIVEGGTNKTI